MCAKNGRMKVLDSGCSDGDDIIDIKKRVEDIDAYGEDMFIKKNKRYMGCVFQKCDIENRADGEYDIIISSEVIHCLKENNIDKYLTNLNKMLNPKGLLVITTFNRKYLWKTLFRLLKKGDSWYHFANSIFTPKELRFLLEQKGFNVEKVIGGRFIYGSRLLNRLDFLPKSITGIRHNFLLAARKVN